MIGECTVVRSSRRKKAARSRAHATGEKYTQALRSTRKVDHRGLAELVSRRVLSQDAADLLPKLVGTRSVVISGPMGSGRSTLMRALIEHIDDGQVIGVAESAPALITHALLCDGSVSDANHQRRNEDERDRRSTPGDILRALSGRDLDLVVVGEISGPETEDLFDVMEGGPRALFTAHATTPEGVITRLVTLTMEGPPHCTEDYSYPRISKHIDVVVQLTKRPRHGCSDERGSYVSEVAIVEPGEGDRPVLSRIYLGNPDGSGTMLDSPRTVDQLQA
ncbi:hypothetical protein GS504_00925 [Rhodococcus hoagii]|nr:hypothetical protein [Prescottella equi]NKS72195.1 hypothetical protein [Prescottella equi]